MASAARFGTAAPSREWLDLRELTMYVAVSERTLRAWIHRPDNPLPAVRVDGKILVHRAQFDMWLERHRIQNVPLDLDGVVDSLLKAVR